MTITATGKPQNKDQNFLHLHTHSIERISANSKWAHSANRLRSAIFRELEQTKDGKSIHPIDPSRLSGQDFAFPKQAARELAGKAIYG